MSEIGNKVTEMPKGIELNEKDYCMCLLTTIKEMEKNYAISMTEASNEWLYETYKHMFLDLSEIQRKIYTQMFRNGWYQLESVSTTKLSDKFNALDADYRSLSE